MNEIFCQEKRRNTFLSVCEEIVIPLSVYPGLRRITVLCVVKWFFVERSVTVDKMLSHFVIISLTFRLVYRLSQ